MALSIGYIPLKLALYGSAPGNTEISQFCISTEWNFKLYFYLRLFMLHFEVSCSKLNKVFG